MESLFNPKSVAIVGASSNPAKLGYQVVKNIIDYGFKGEIYPVNVKRENVLDRRTYASLLEIGAEVDCVVIVVPAPVVKSVIQDCVQIKAKNAVIITAGFRETGKEGLELEEEIGKIASKGNLRILGPNCLGFISASSHFNCTFASEASIPENGNIYLISQSGAIGTAILDWAKKNKVGISRFVSIGNKLDISEVELLSNVKKGEVVGLYLESLTQGKELLSIGKKISKTNPVIVLKPGKTAAGSSAITSHTGAMATDSVVVSTLFNQAGFLEVDGIEGMFDLLKAFSWQPMLKDNRIGIVTNAGGPAVITTDLLVQAGLNIAQLTDRTHQILLDRLPREANIHNPIDVIGDALADRYAAAIDAVLADENTDALLVLLTPQVTTQIERTANFIYRLSKTHGKPVLASFIGGSLVDQGVEILNRHKIPNFNFPERAIYVLSKMYTYTKQIELITNQS